MLEHLLRNYKSLNSTSYVIHINIVNRGALVAAAERPRDLPPALPVLPLCLCMWRSTQRDSRTSEDKNYLSILSDSLASKIDSTHWIVS